MNKETLVPFGVGEIIEDAEKEIRVPIKLLELKDNTNPHFRYSFHDNESFVKIIGASGNEESNVEDLKIMTDPLTPQARKDMIDCAYTDAILSPSVFVQFEVVH